MAKIKMSSRLKQLMSELFEKLARQNSLKEGALEGMTFGDQIQTDTDGVIPNSRVLMSTNASNNDTLTIGGHVIKFVTSLASAYTFTQVKIGGDAATTRASLCNALNGVADSDNIVEATTTFKSAMATLGAPLYADQVSTKVRIRLASVHGAVGSLNPASSPSVTLAANLTTSAAWDVTNLNASGGIDAGKRVVVTQFTITAAMITAAEKLVECPFTPTAFSVQCRSSSGVIRALDEAVTISGDAIRLVFAGGSSPNWQATDTCTLTIRE
jgi:hypothetical protein